MWLRPWCPATTGLFADVCMQLRQGLGLTGDLEPTSLDAHRKMLDDCQEFSPHISRLERAVGLYENHSIGMCAVTLRALHRQHVSGL